MCCDFVTVGTSAGTTKPDFPDFRSVLFVEGTLQMRGPVMRGTASFAGLLFCGGVLCSRLLFCGGVLGSRLLFFGTHGTVFIGKGI